MLPFSLTLALKCFILSLLALRRDDHEAQGLAFMLGVILVAVGFLLRWM
jgi:hypothetical protein